MIVFTVDYPVRIVFISLLVINLFTFSGKGQDTHIPQRVITGKVTSTNPSEGVLPGVSVLVKGTSLGTITDEKGEYRLEVSNEDAVLVVSFIGHITQELTTLNRSVIDIILVEDVQSLEEIVVTGLSIQRDKNSLGYSVTKVSSDALSQVKINNPIGSLAGRVAGLQISATPSGVDGSTRVVLRGVSSLSGTNRPLVVVDGVPVDGSSYGGASTGGGRDFGDALSDINRNDVESIIVLKGAGAAAVYGSRGSNGVLLITTKSGRNRKGIGISLNSSYLMTRPFVVPRLQNEYGQGAFGIYPDEPYGKVEPYIWSWGPKLEGQVRPNWLREMKPLVAQPNPYKKFYNPGFSAINTLAFDGGDSKSSFRASVTLQSSQGFIPTNSVNKQTVNMRGRSQLRENIEIDGKVTYIHSQTKDRPYLGEDSANAGWAMSSLPRNVPLQELEDNIVDKDNNEYWEWDKTLGNPYWALKNKRNEDEKNRIQSLLSLKVNFSNSLDLQVRSGFDYTSRNVKEYADTGSPVNSEYRGTFSQNFGSDLEWNSDFIFNYHQSIGSMINYSLSLGGNYRYNISKGLRSSGNGWKIPDFYNISNLDNYNTSTWFNQKEVLSTYFLGNISFGAAFYFDVLYRSDWSSTLPLQNNHFPFYSVNGSVVITELLKTKSSVINKAQVRGSYGVTGNDTDPYKVNNYYSIAQNALPYNIGSPNGSVTSDSFKPEITVSWEAGIDFDFLNSAINLDVTYYTANTKNQILNVKLPPSSGFNNVNANAGNIRNSGIEALISSSILRKNNKIQWNASLNITHNKSEVVSLAEGQSRLVLLTSVLGLVTVEVRPGDPFGAIYGHDYIRDVNGNKIIGETGYPISPVGEPLKFLGSINPDLTGGLNNKLSYRNFSLGLLVDFQLGGKFYSHGQYYRSLMGTSEESLEGRAKWYATHEGSSFSDDISGVIPKGYVESGVVENTGKKNKTPVDPMLHAIQVYYFGKTVTDFIMDASNVRLREVSIGYSIPRPILKKTPFVSANISIVGRNVLFFYNAAKHVDPESGFSSSSIGNAFELNSMPTARTYGINVNLSF